MKLKFIYSADAEYKNVIFTLKSRSFLKKFNYVPTLPTGYDLDSKDLSGIKAQIKKEMKSAKVDNVRKAIEQKWQKNEVILNKLWPSLSYDVPDEMSIELTKYGNGGLYWPPNKVVINVNTWKDCFENSVHETIHCLIEKPIIDKYALDHRQKEGLVDWLFLKNKYLKELFPDYLQQESIKAEPPTNEFLAKIGWAGKLNNG